MKKSDSHNEAMAAMRLIAKAYRSGNFGCANEAYFSNLRVFKDPKIKHINRAASKLAFFSELRLDQAFLETNIPAAYQNMIPAAYQNTIPAAHPCPSALECAIQAANWWNRPSLGTDKSKKVRAGVILHGKDRFVTTSAAFAMLSRWTQRDGGGFRFQRHSAYDLICNFSGGEALIFEKYLSNPHHALFVEDLAGIYLRKEVAKVFLDFIVELVRRELLFVVTVDQAGDDLARHWSALDPSIFSICQDIVGRIRDYSDVIHFAPEEKVA